MAQCLIKTPQYWTALKQSGIPEVIFNAVVNDFVAKHGRFPNLDEIPGSNSTKFIKDTLQLSEFNSINVEDLLNITGTSSIEEANIALNDKYADVEVEITPVNKQAIINITRRPSLHKVEEKSIAEIDENPNMGIVFNNIANRLGSLYGINIIPITDKELAQPKWKGIAEVKSTNAFIYNNNIYINTDLASADAPIHELTHLLLGSIRFKNPDLYFETIKQAQNFKSFNQMVARNPNKTQSDVLEETFVSEVAKYLADMPSDIDAFDDNIKYELHYNIKRLIDSVFMGEYSVDSISNPGTLSIKELARQLNSAVLQNEFQGSIDDANLHRRLANTREQLIKNHQVEENCL